MSVPNLALVTRAVVHEDSTVTLLARVVVDAANELSYHAQADYSGITYSVNGATAVALTVASVVYNSLQTGTIWGVDSTGFNFKTKLAAGLFPSGATLYYIRVAFTLTSADVFHVDFEVVTRGRPGQ